MPHDVGAQGVRDGPSVIIPLPPLGQPGPWFHRDFINPNQRVKVAGQDLEVLKEGDRAVVVGVDPGHHEP